VVAALGLFKSRLVCASSPTHLKVGKAIPDPIATPKANGQHFSDTTNYNEIVATDDLDRVRKYHRAIPGDQSRQKLGGKNRP
jgi:hypothetical protein